MRCCVHACQAGLAGAACASPHRHAPTRGPHHSRHLLPWPQAPTVVMIMWSQGPPTPTRGRCLRPRAPAPPTPPPWCGCTIRTPVSPPVCCAHPCAGGLVRPRLDEARVPPVARPRSRPRPRPRASSQLCLLLSAPSLPSPPPPPPPAPDEVKDVYAGLVGALVIGRKGEVKEDLTAKDVDRWVGGRVGGGGLCEGCWGHRPFRAGCRVSIPSCVPRLCSRLPAWRGPAPSPHTPHNQRLPVTTSPAPYRRPRRTGRWFCSSWWQTRWSPSTQTPMRSAWASPPSRVRLWSAAVFYRTGAARDARASSAPASLGPQPPDPFPLPPHPCSLGVCG